MFYIYCKVFNYFTFFRQDINQNLLCYWREVKDVCENHSLYLNRSLFSKRFLSFCTTILHFKAFFVSTQHVQYIWNYSNFLLRLHRSTTLKPTLRSRCNNCTKRSGDIKNSGECTCPKEWSILLRLFTFSKKVPRGVKICHYFHSKSL